jgi:hypothetical protein
MNGLDAIASSDEEITCYSLFLKTKEQFEQMYL